MSEWQPIETAPKDYETLILAAFRGGIGMDIVWWRSDTGRWQTKSEHSWAANVFTHWMPLPEPPQ